MLGPATLKGGSRSLRGVVLGEKTYWSTILKTSVSWKVGPPFRYVSCIEGWANTRSVQVAEDG